MNIKFLYLPVLAFCFSDTSTAMDLEDKDTNSTIQISQNIQEPRTYNLKEDEGIGPYQSCFSSYFFRIKNSTLYKAVEGDITLLKDDKKYICSLISKYNRNGGSKEDPEEVVWITGVGPMHEDTQLPIHYSEEKLPKEFRTVEWNHIRDAVFYNGSYYYLHFSIKEITDK